MISHNRHRHPKLRTQENDIDAHHPVLVEHLTASSSPEWLALVLSDNYADMIFGRASGVTCLPSIVSFHTRSRPV